MTQKITWTCDGCDAATTAAPNTEPAGWANIAIAVNSGGADQCKEVFERYDLCPDCLQALPERLNPKKWARTAA